MDKFDPSDEQILWYQLDARELEHPHVASAYYNILDNLATDPDIAIDFVFCPQTNTINLAGKAGAFLLISHALRDAGFVEKSQPSDGILDPQQREEFIKMILEGGSYSG